MADVNTTLAQRAELYGEIPYAARAKVSQELKKALRSAPGWDLLDDSQKEAMEMIAHKQARIVAGAATHADNWHDIGGYATLAEKDLIGAIAAAVAPAAVAPSMEPSFRPTTPPAQPVAPEVPAAVEAPKPTKPAGPAVVVPKIDVPTKS